MLVRMVGVEPYLTSIKSRVPDRQATFAYFVSLTLCIYYIIKRGICQQVFENSLIFFKGYLNFQAYYKFRGTYCPISTGDVTRIFIRVLLPYFPSLYYILIIPQYNKSVKRFLKNIRNYFSKAIPYPLWVRLRHTESSVLYPNGAGLKSVQCLTLLTLLLQHTWCYLSRVF